jgi:quinol monooxygenase YgiN
VIVEHARFRSVVDDATLAAAAERMVATLAAAEGTASIRLARGIEDSNDCVLTIEWHELADHLERFHGSPASSELRSVMDGVLTERPAASHYRILAEYTAPPEVAHD